MRKAKPSSSIEYDKEGSKVLSQSQPMPIIKVHDTSSQTGSRRVNIRKGITATSQRQRNSHMRYIEDKRKIVPTEPESRREAGAEPTTRKVELVSREDQEALEKKLQKMTRHEQNMLILKNFLKVSQEEVGNDSVFFANSFPSETDFDGVEEKVMKMATRLAMVSLMRLRQVKHVTEILKGRDCYDAFEESLFKSIAKFILRIVDLEDLERFNCFDELMAEYRKFFVEVLFHLKSGNDPYKLVADGKIKFDGFPLLREQDVGFLLEQYDVVRKSGLRFLDVVPLFGFGDERMARCCLEESGRDRFVEMARTVLLEYIVKEGIKKHSVLDFHVCRNGCTFDAFKNEAVSNAVGSPKWKARLTNDEVGILATMANEQIGLCFSGFTAKCDRIVCCASGALLNAMVYGPFGSFAKEARDLVNIADAERRFQCHHFISKNHILRAVGVTEYKKFVDRLVSGVKLGDIPEEHATRPPYKVYELAGAIANKNGVKFVGVEHIVGATIFAMRKERFKNLRMFKNTSCVREFLRDVEKYKQRKGFNYCSPISLNLNDEFFGRKMKEEVSSLREKEKEVREEMSGQKEKEREEKPGVLFTESAPRVLRAGKREQILI